MTHPGGKISGDQLHFSYRPEQEALSNVSVELQPGTFAAILGPNGSGKSTLLRVLSSALKPQRGHVAIDDRPLPEWSRPELGQTLAVVPQDTHIAFPYTVTEIVLMGRAPHLGRLQFESKNDTEIARQAMEDTGVFHLADRLYTECSGGEQQRVLLARALTQQPRVLLLDEPTSHLDLRHQVGVYQLLHRLNTTTRMTIAIVSHDLNLPAQLCSHGLLLNGGRVAACGAIDEVLTPHHIHNAYGDNVGMGTDAQTKRPFFYPVAIDAKVTE